MIERLGDVVVVMAFFPACEDSGRRFDDSFPSCALKKKKDLLLSGKHPMEKQVSVLADQ